MTAVIFVFSDLVVSCDAFTSFLKFVLSFWNQYTIVSKLGNVESCSGAAHDVFMSMETPRVPSCCDRICISLSSQFFRMSSVLCLFWEILAQTLSHWKLRYDFIQLRIIYLNFFKQFIDSQFYRVCWFAIHIF